MVGPKPPGPLHDHDVPPEPVAFRIRVAPTHSGPLFDTLTLGLAFTVAVVLAEAVHPVVVLVRVTVYEPE